MTYEEKVHNFGLRWIMDNSSTVARLREMDLTKLITLETSVDGYGCSCDYDYDVTYELKVPTLSGQSFTVSLPDSLTFAEILKGVVEAEPVELSGVADLVMEGQAAQIVKLQTELNEVRAAKGRIDGELRVLKNGMSQQQGLWTYLRNLYKDLQDYTDGSSGLTPTELEELCNFLYKELDLWFNKDIGTAEANGRSVWKINTTRTA